MKSMRKIIADIVHYFTRRGYGSKKWKKQFAYFGKGARVVYPAEIQGYEGISIGDNTSILEYSRIANFQLNIPNCRPRISIGNNCYICYYFTILNASNVTIGDDVLIASHVMISSENHGMDPETEKTYMAQPVESKPVSIGYGCWIGEKVCILPGVNIGKKCVIGAGSVVTKSIPDYSIAAGNPAKVIKKYNFETHNWEKV